ncbi:MAG TPA: fatty acid desaturase [Planctomycetaceae bacterium]|nr:fatty acid desaturase [Planctomycetaceae bacterium]
MSTTIDPVREKRHKRRKYSRDEVRPAAVSEMPPAIDTAEGVQATFSPDRLLKRDHMDWVVLGWMTAMHVGALAAPFYFSWPAFGAFALLHWLTGSIGICLCFHRYLTHKSMKLATPARFFTMLCGVLSGEGTPLTWVAAHRLHHQRSDQSGDPHSPLDGPWWSHMWWMLVYRTPAEREALFHRYIPDLVNDPLMRMFERTYILWHFALAGALYAIGGVPMLLWGFCLRMVVMYHSTWFVNSATHLWGYRNYTTRDESRNLWWVAILAYGEGWHNNHHAHPHTARAGHRWWELDPTFWSIRFLQLIGQAKNVDDRTPALNAEPDAAAA